MLFAPKWMLQTTRGTLKLLLVPFGHSASPLWTTQFKASHVAKSIKSKRNTIWWDLGQATHPPCGPSAGQGKWTCYSHLHSDSRRRARLRDNFWPYWWLYGWLSYVNMLYWLLMSFICFENSTSPSAKAALCSSCFFVLWSQGHSEIFYQCTRPCSEAMKDRRCSKYSPLAGMLCSSHLSKWVLLLSEVMTAKWCGRALSTPSSPWYYFPYLYLRGNGHEGQGQPSGEGRKYLPLWNSHVPTAMYALGIVMAPEDSRNAWPWAEISRLKHFWKANCEVPVSGNCFFFFLALRLRRTFFDLEASRNTHTISFGIVSELCIWVLSYS